MPKHQTGEPELDARSPVRPSHFDHVAASWRRELPAPSTDTMLLSIGLIRLGRMIEALHDRMLRNEFDVSGAEMRVVLALRRAGRPYALRPTDLFRALLLSSGAITKQVDRLIIKGLVERLPDPLHGGGFLVQLTGRGVKIAQAASAAIGDLFAFNKALEMLPPALRAAGETFIYRTLRELEHLADTPDGPGGQDSSTASILRARSARASGSSPIARLPKVGARPAENG